MFSGTISVFRYSSIAFATWIILIFVSGEQGSVISNLTKSPSSIIL